MLKKIIKDFFKGWFDVILLVCLFEGFVFIFGTLFSQTDDFYSLLGIPPLEAWIFYGIFNFIVSFMRAYTDNKNWSHKKNSIKNDDIEEAVRHGYRIKRKKNLKKQLLNMD